ncbi:CHAT domain-containing protein [Spirosoma harenae]
MYRTLEKSPDANIRQLFTELKTVKAALATQYSRPIRERSNVSELQTRADGLEQKLNQQSQQFRDIRKDILIQWPQVLQSLKPREAAIEFVSFDDHNDKCNCNDSTVYAAFVIRPGYVQPHFVRLFEQRQLDKLLARSGETVEAQVNAIFREGVKAKSVTGSAEVSQGVALSRLIWQPIISLLAGVKTVYYAPAGNLHQVAFAALPHPRYIATRLSDSLTLQQVGSTRQLVQRTSIDYLPKNFTAAVYGNIVYSIDSLTLARRAIPTRSKQVKSDLKAGQHNKPFSELPGTIVELDSMKKYVTWQQGVSWYTNTSATEEQVKVHSGQGPDALHVSTTGISIRVQ